MHTESLVTNAHLFGREAYILQALFLISGKAEILLKESLFVGSAYIVLCFELTELYQVRVV